MEDAKAKEYVEGGVGMGIAYGERLMELAASALDSQEINPAEYDTITRLLVMFEGLAIERYMQSRSRGTHTDEMLKVISDMDNSLRANPAIAIESIIQLATPESIDIISCGDVPSQCVYILKSLGWQRPAWNVERMESALVTECRRLTGKGRPKRGKK